MGKGKAEREIDGWYFSWEWGIGVIAGVSSFSFFFYLVCFHPNSGWPDLVLIQKSKKPLWKLLASACV